ncbi:GAF domain-containing protein [Thermosynechococcus sp.]|uniref:GAF domain-containing protein n=1 Tax=Thermosynechococcus sp. TaxID=2814275 RepID=UPI0039196F18
MTPVIEQLQSLNRILVELARRQPFHSANFEEMLQDILGTSARSLKVERVSLWFYSGDRQHIECVQLFQQSAQAFTAAGMRLTASDYPRYFAALQEERTITAHDAWFDPRTQEFRQSYLEPLGITSLLDVPILGRRGDDGHSLPRARGATAPVDGCGGAVCSFPSGSGVLGGGKSRSPPCRQSIRGK